MAGLAAGDSPPVDVPKTFSDVDAVGQPSFQTQLYQYYDKKATEKAAASPSPRSFGRRGAIIVAVNQSEEEQHYTGRFGTRFEASTRLKKIMTQCFRGDTVDAEETMVTRHNEATDSVLLMRLQAFLQTTKPPICGLEEAYEPYQMKRDEKVAYKCEAEDIDPTTQFTQVQRFKHVVFATHDVKLIEAAIRVYRRDNTHRESDGTPAKKLHIVHLLTEKTNPGELEKIREKIGWVATACTCLDDDPPEQSVSYYLYGKLAHDMATEVKRRFHYHASLQEWFTDNEAVYKPDSGLVPAVASEFSRAERNNANWLWTNIDRGGKPGTKPQKKDTAVQIEHAKRTAGNITALPWNTPDGCDLSAVAGANNVLVLWDNDTPMFFDKAESKIVESFGRAYVKKTKDAQYYDPKTTKDLYDKNKEKFNSYYKFVMRRTSDPTALNRNEWNALEEAYDWPTEQRLTRTGSAPESSHLIL